MTREDIKQEVLDLRGNNWLLELGTGVGKSKLALDKLKSLNLKKSKLLIVVPRNVHKLNWADEIHKWWSTCNLDISYTTYVSFPKYKGDWDAVIFDECHHLSERCREALCDFNIKYSILLSATVSKNLKDEFREVFDNLACYKLSLRDTIDNGILPDPTVYLIPLRLDTNILSETIIKNPKAKGPIVECNWINRWNFIKQKNYKVRIICTERQYYEDLSSQINYWKNRYMRTKNEIYKNKWLRLCNNRLVWLSNKKTNIAKDIISHFNDYRTLTFCNSIEQTEALGKYCINSKNKDSLDNYNNFNGGKINHITACNMLNESMNLVNCQIGIYANLNSSETIVKQRTGRLLRHPKPIIVIPYFKNTRDEELLNKMLENYNMDLVHTIDYINEIHI